MKEWVLMLAIYSEGHGAKPEILSGFENAAKCQNAGGKLLSEMQRNIKDAKKYLEIEWLTVPSGSFVCTEIEK